MAFPVPPDARATSDFEPVRGLDEMIRQSAELLDPAVSVDEGEWMKPATGGKAAKLEASDTLAEPAMGAKVSWTRYRPDDFSNGQSDALATKTVDLLSGSYQARTKLFNAASLILDPGSLLVATFDATLGGGFLDALPADGSATVRQLQAVVGRIIDVSNGVMHYEAPGL